MTEHAVTLRLVNLLSDLRFSALSNPSGLKTGADIDQHARPYSELRDQVTEFKQAETRCGVDSQGEAACFPAHAARERSEQTLIAWPRRWRRCALLHRGAGQWLWWVSRGLHAGNPAGNTFSVSPWPAFERSK